MSDETIDKLGTYFVHYQILQRFGIPFSTFVEMVKTGRWREFIA